jgi:phenylpropionate dioxygenase-like ring-hydroxylating dioxygenase large terminal subunit
LVRSQKTIQEKLDELKTKTKHEVSKEHLKMSLEKKSKLYNFATNPRLEYPNDKGELTWFPIGFAHQFKDQRGQQVTIRDINYFVWKYNHTYYAVRDACSHQGSSFKNGCVHKNTVTCPYHGYQFNGNGTLIDIPQIDIMQLDNDNYHIDSYKVVEKAGMVYLNTVPIPRFTQFFAQESSLNESFRKILDEDLIWVEPEAFEKDNTCVYLEVDFNHNARFVSMNSLDICHIAHVHTFGNKKSPNPLNIPKILRLNDTGYHYKTFYEYLTGENSIAKKIYKNINIRVENEYILPHTTVARAYFANHKSTTVSYALPVSKFKTKLFVKTYRDYWYIPSSLESKGPLHIPFSILNKIGDEITYKTMIRTLMEDKAIVDNIEKSDVPLMNGKFSILYDLLNNHYRKLYHIYYDEDEASIK